MAQQYGTVPSLRVCISLLIIRHMSGVLFFRVVNEKYRAARPRPLMHPSCAHPQRYSGGRGEWWLLLLLTHAGGGETENSNPTLCTRFFLPVLAILLFQNLSLGASEGGDDLAALPSAAPGRGQRGRLLKKQASQSVKNLLDTVGTPDTRYMLLY